MLDHVCQFSNLHIHRRGTRETLYSPYTYLLYASPPLLPEQEFLSELGIVHRDLACRNVLVGENKVLKISDFGMARENDIYVRTTDGKLPLRWMAIESIVDRVFTTKSDVWVDQWTGHHLLLIHII